MKKFARLAAFGALGVAFGVAALYLVIVIGGGVGSGLDVTGGVLVWLGAGVPAAAIIAAHLAFAVHLFRYDKENRS